MGYTTEFEGSFRLNKKAERGLQLLLNGLSRTRRMKLNVGAEYGYQGEFYFDEPTEEQIIDRNSPPAYQPGLWCSWELESDDYTISWDGSEKFYNYIEWLDYIIERILRPSGYILSGEVEWFGEERDDIGKIIVKNNEMTVLYGYIEYRYE